MIIITKDGKVALKSDFLGFVGEHNARRVRVVHPEFQGAEYRIYFDVDNENPYMTELSGDSFTVDNSILISPGEVKMQFSAIKNGEMVFKSEVFKMRAEKSIKGTPKACPTYEQAQDIYERINKAVGSAIYPPKIEGENWFVYDNDLQGYVDTGIKASGKEGFSPLVEEKTNTPTEYILRITDKNGSFDTPNLKGKDGTGAGGAVNSVNGLSGDVILTADDIDFADGENFQQKLDRGVLNGADGRNGTDGKNGSDGKDGFSPVIKEKVNTAEQYTLEITNKDGSFITPNLKGKDGTGGGSGSGAVNSVNGQTGAVVLTADDINTVSGDSIEVAIGNAGKVQSVNEKTGIVTLKAKDITTENGNTVEDDVKSNKDRIAELEDFTGIKKTYIDVTVTSADGNIPTGITITVDAQTKVFEGTNPVRFDVEMNTQYTVSVSDWEGGTTPAVQTITTGERGSTTAISFEYTQMPDVGKAFNEYTPAELKKISEAEAWADYNFQVGDRHAIDITGTVNGIDLTGTWYAMIIGFNHNAEKEGTGITLQFANDALTGGNNLAFMQYQMNTSNTNAGGWKSSIMRTTTCAEFYNALPQEWKAIIKTTTKYTDNQGGVNDNNPITATEDKIFILSEWEVHGSRTYANLREQNYQLQYDYYKAGNTKVKYNHTSTSSAVDWWVRSPLYGYDALFCRVNPSGSPTSYSAGASRSYGFAPAFVI